MDSREHAAQADFLMAVAKQPPVAANRQLRSEALWGAATQMVKAVAKAHNRANRSHRQMFLAVRWIEDNVVNDPELADDFSRIERLHVNFYDGELSNDEIAQLHNATERFVAKMQRILNAADPAAADPAV